MGVKNDSSFRFWGHTKFLYFMVGIEIDSTSVLGSKLTWFGVGVKIDFVLV